jgi:hypothetical protein
MIHEVYIVPALGYDGERYDRGHCIGTMSSLDVIDRYVAALYDELDTTGVRVRKAETRKKPGVPYGQRHCGISPNTLVLHCDAGWSYAKHPPKVNRSRVLLGMPEASELGCLVGEAVVHWGKTYCCYFHAGITPIVDVDDPVIAVAGTVGLRLEPFQLNGPDVGAYMVKLETLGRDIGRAIADYILTRGPAGHMAANSGELVPRLGMKGSPALSRVR